MKICNIITGSIAAYKQIDLLRALQAQGHTVEVVLTRSAAHFVSQSILETFCAGKVWSDDVMASESDGQMRHIRLAKESDVILVAPATADMIAKMAHGHGDTLALATLLATSKPVWVAPAMNPTMWQHPATQANVQLLKDRGVRFLGPLHGLVACGDVGEGKYINETTLLEALTAHASVEGPLTGRRVVITLGSTREYLDPVRYLGNVSSGATGVALAKAFMAKGAQVTLICGYVTVDLPDCVVIPATTAEEMFEAAQSALPADIFVGCAAVCDYRPAICAPHKMKKDPEGLTVSLVPNRDVLASVAQLVGRPPCVIGFALESEEGDVHAQDKLAHKNLDGIILNQVSHLGQDQNAYVFFSRHERQDQGLLTREAFAQIFVENVVDGYFESSSRRRQG